MSSKDRDFDLELFFQALSDKTRLRLLNLISEDEICVCFFIEVLGELQPKISRHLAFLKKAGLVSARRDGKWMHYKIAPPTNPYAKQILDCVIACLREDKEMQRDRARLIKVCCMPSPPLQILGAPKPTLINLND